MFTTNQNIHLEQTHKQHLWQRLQQRVVSAQADPIRLALLEQEARDLGITLVDFPRVSEPAPDRLTQTLQALSHIRVEH